MAEIQNFNHPKFGKIRAALGEKGEPLACLNDVCKCLDITNPRNIKTRLDERGVHSIDTPTQNQFGATVMQKMTYIDEPNLYRCIFQSRKAEATEFQDWVFEKVLPSIRKHGAFVTPNKLMEMLTKPESVTALLTQLQDEQMRRIEAEQTIEQQRPKVEFADAVESSKGCIYIAQLANLLHQNGYVTGQNRLFQTLRDLGYLYKTKHGTRPMQSYIEMGLFEVKVNVYEDDETGNTYESLTTMVTPKGQRYFIEMFCSK